jgi:hypothetical protein
MAKNETMAERLAEAERRLTYVDGSTRKRGAALLFLGVVFGSCGFFFAFITGWMKFHHAARDFPSGNGYFPSTVSEMVSDPTDPAGKAFFAFEFIGAVFIFLSWYPTELRNVYVGDDDRPCCDVSWVMFRQFIPAPGMMLVACVTTTPIQTATPRDQFTIFIHLCGAMMMFVGFWIIEQKTLKWRMSPLTTDLVALGIIGKQELFLRKFFLFGIMFFYSAFLAIQVIVGIPGIEAILCCPDIFEAIDPDQPEHLTLMNTAHSKFFILKLLSYICEVMCGWSLLGSHFVIWYFCSERFIDLEDELSYMGAPNTKEST